MMSRSSPASRSGGSSVGPRGASSSALAGSSPNRWSTWARASGSVAASTVHRPLERACMAVPPSWWIPMRTPVNCSTMAGPDTKAKASLVMTTRSARPRRNAGPEMAGPVTTTTTGTAPEHLVSARALTKCSGAVPVVVVVTGPAISGPAFLLGLADLVVMTSDAFAFVSGPAMVEQFTGVRIGIHQLGGTAMHARSSGLCTVEAATEPDALAHVDHLLGLLPANADELAPLGPTDDPPDRDAGELRDIIPARATSSYDVRRVAAALSDDHDVTELWTRWSPQLVTALGRIAGRTVGFVANQPQALAGTLDIAASQKGARFVRFCDAFNLPLVTLVDTPGFLPGKDLEWRGMIRHGAELAFAYAEATVPRVCVILRKAFGGAYIVMDSKGLGNDLCFAWPGAEIAVMGAEGAVQILHRTAGREEREQREAVRWRICTCLLY